MQNLSDEKQFIKLSTDAGFVKTAAPGRYFMTRNAEEFSESDGHFGCREYTLPRDYASSTPRGWIREYTLPRDYASSTPRGWTRESTKVGLAIEVVTNYHQGNQELRSRLVLYLEMDLSRGSEFRADLTNS